MKSEALMPAPYRCAPPAAGALSVGKTRSADNQQSRHAAADRMPFPASTAEKTIDVFERSSSNCAVPDERSGIDRRQSIARRQSFPAFLAVQAGEKVDQAELSSVNLKAASAYSRAANIPPVIFSPPQQKGKLIDIWV